MEPNQPARTNGIQRRTLTDALAAQDSPEAVERVVTLLQDVTTEVPSNLPPFDLAAFLTLNYDVACKLTTVESEHDKIISDYLRNKEVNAAFATCLVVIKDLLSQRNPTYPVRTLPLTPQEAITLPNALRYELDYLLERLTSEQRKELDAWRVKRPVLKEFRTKAWIPGIPNLANGTLRLFTVKIGNGKTRELYWLQDSKLDNFGDTTHNTGWHTVRSTAEYPYFYELYTGTVKAYQVNLV
jgi:hypothetical protein